MYTYKLGGLLITDELYHDDLDAMTFGRKDQNELYHYGIKGQSWGKRRFQNEDGSLTAAGRNRYDVGDSKQGVTAYSDTGGRGGSGVRTYKGVSNKSAISTNSQNRYRGASGGGGSIRPNGSPTTRTYGGGTNGSSSYSFEYNEGPGQSAGRSVTNKVKAKVNNTVNSGKKAADNLFSSIGNWASNAANDVGKAATNAYNDVSKAAGNIANDAKNWAGNAIKDVNNFVDKNVTGNSARDLATSLNMVADAFPNSDTSSVRRSAEESQAEADKSLLGRIGNAANWVGDRAQDVGKAATNAYNDVSKAAGDAVNWVGDRVRDVGNLVSNQDEKRAAENAQNVADRVLEDAIARSGEYVPDEKGGEDLYIRDYNDAKVVDAADKRAADAQQAYENHPLTKIQNAANDVKSMFSDGSKEREALAEARSKVDKYADDPEFMSYFYKDNPEEAKRFADEQIEARKQLKQAENNYMDFSNNPVNTVSRALNLPNNKGNWAFAVPGNEQYLQTMKTGFIPKTENIGDWFTGNNYKRAADTHNQYAKDYDDLAEQAYAYGRESAETGRGPSQDWWNSEGDYIKNVYAKEDRDIANANMNLYNNAPRQKIVNAANQVGEAVSGAAKGVGDWASNAASDVRDWGAGALDKGRQAFENLFGRSEPANNERLDPTPRTFTEQRIEEQRIPEQMIYEQTIPEQLIREELIREKRR